MYCNKNFVTAAIAVGFLCFATVAVSRAPELWVWQNAGGPADDEDQDACAKNDCSSPSLGFISKQPLSFHDDRGLASLGNALALDCSKAFIMERCTANRTDCAQQDGLEERTFPWSEEPALGRVGMHQQAPSQVVANGVFEIRSPAPARLPESRHEFRGIEGSGDIVFDSTRERNVFDESINYYDVSVETFYSSDDESHTTDICEEIDNMMISVYGDESLEDGDIAEEMYSSVQASRRIEPEDSHQHRLQEMLKHSGACSYGAPADT